MGFYPQPNDWSCGPFALKHALVALGRMVDENDIARRAKTHWWSGTDEIGLARAARAYGAELELFRRRSAERARRDLIAALRERLPVLLCVDGWGHWITVLGCARDQFVIVDSNADPVLDIAPWPRLRRRWVYRDTDYDPDDPPELYDGCIVRPTNRVPMRATFSVARVRHLRHARNRDLAEHWDEYLGDLLAICRPRDQRMVAPLSMAEFLRRHGDLIVSRVVYWHGDVTTAHVSRLLRNFRFVAERYGLVIPNAVARRAIADLAILATMWAVATRGIGSLYGAGE
ncbi:MAG: hypothetical protein D6689_19965 [Deltaproteobacteria bacterium]|nr:MAG: hypothetical protein D6689_19965 [Deltaproteobacteria bacterium]